MTHHHHHHHHHYHLHHHHQHHHHHHYHLHHHHQHHHHMSRYSESGSISPPCIPSPPPPVTTSTLERLRSKASAFPLPPPAFPHSGDSLRAPPPSFPHCNGHINNINMIDVDNKKSAVDVSNELSRRVMELGKERSVEPESSMGHLQLNHLPSLSLPHTNSQQRPRWQQDGRAPNGSSTNFM